MELAASIVFWLAVVAGVVGAAVCLFAWSMGQESAKQIDKVTQWVEDESDKRTNTRPHVFVSYTVKDLSRATNIGRQLEASGAEVTMMNPQSLWQDPLGKVAHAIERAEVTVVVEPEGQLKSWVRCEMEIAAAFGARVCRATKGMTVATVVADVTEDIVKVNWPKRLFECTSSEPYMNVLRIVRKYAEDNRDPESGPISSKYSSGSESGAQIHHYWGSESPQGTVALFFGLGLLGYFFGGIVLAIALLLFAISGVLWILR